MSDPTSPTLMKRRFSCYHVNGTDGDRRGAVSVATDPSDESLASTAHDGLSCLPPSPTITSAIRLGDSLTRDQSTGGLFSSWSTSSRRKAAGSPARRRLWSSFTSGSRRNATRVAAFLVCLLLLSALATSVALETSLTVSFDNPLRHLLELREPSEAPWAVLVQHKGAVSRLNFTDQQRCRVGTLFCEPLRVGTAFVPAWTLRVVDGNCKDCLDTLTRANATGAVELDHSSHGVFATSAAPLGRIGPMVLAMASVTDDVDVRVELPQWAWLRHVYGDAFPTAGGVAEAAPGGGAAAGAPYLAVMGIPSTDQRARVALRDAQRRTWLSYQEVARNDNQFRGALLTLYVFAAVEPAPVVVPEPNVTSTTPPPSPTLNDTVEGDAATTTTTTPPTTTVGPEAKEQERLKLLLPTTEEYGAAADTLLALAEAEAAEAQAGARYQQRRMTLRRDWGVTAVDDTPCAEVVTTWSDGTAATSALAYLAQSLSLPVTPAFTAPAAFICAASSALWQEALTHRNVVWIDMMTDRRPTTDKKLGDTTKWGLPVEVGMSQKLILWLEYAYHAFPTVPFIIKGDDDSYMKVPQFLSDVRYVMSGAQVRSPPPASADGGIDVEGAGTPTSPAPASPHAATVECAYWGSMRVFQNAQFNAGMTFMLHRTLAQVVLEPPGEEKRVDIAKMAMMTFDPRLSKVYRAARFHQEDILLGLLIRQSLTRARDQCLNNRVWFVREGLPRFHDMHRGKMHDVTWSTVVAHRCTPADTYYLHHYFQAELAATLKMSNRNGRAEKAAVEQAAEWVRETRRTMGPEVVGWDALPDVRWVRNTRRTPKYDMADADGVAVYHNKYTYWVDRPTAVDDGFMSQPSE